MSDEVLAALSALGRVLTKVLLAQAVGYWMKSSKSIPDAALTGIGAFAGLVSLPALLFKAVAVLDFSQVDITLVVALTLGKLLLVAISAHLGQITADSSPGAAELAGGCFGLLTTNSDDLGLGLPVLGAIFPPQLVSMCFVLNALQSMLINPLIFVLFGVGKARRDAPPDGQPPASNTEIVIAVVRGLRKNFIIVSVVSGVLYNALFGQLRGATLPIFLDDLCTLLSAAFGPMVQFLAGAANVGSFGKLAQLDSALLPLLTVLLKSVLLPAFVISIIAGLGGSRGTMDFAFAFNCLPTAGSTLVFARPYAPGPKLDSLLSSGLALGKLLGFPLLFVAAAVFKTTSVHDILSLESAVAVAMQALSSAASLPMVASVLWAGSRWGKPPLRLVFVLACTTLGYTSLSLGAKCGFVSHASAFPFISFFRWAADATLMLSVLARHLEASHRLVVLRHRAPGPPETVAGSGAERMGGAHAISPMGASRSGRPRDLEAPLLAAHGTNRRLPLTGSASAFALQLLLATGTGLILTLPWTYGAQPLCGKSCSDPFPDAADDDVALGPLHAGEGSTRLPISSGPTGAEDAFPMLRLLVGTAQASTHAHLPLWVPFGDGQELAYAVVYAVMALLLLCSSSVVLRIDAQTAAVLHAKVQGKALPMRLLRLQQRHSFYVRFECLAFILGTRLVLASAICAQLAVDAQDVMLTGSMALMLLVHALMANATGALLFVLFGLGEGLFSPDLIRRAFSPHQAILALPPGARPTQPTGKRRSVVVEELLDASEAVATGTGFEQPPKLKTVFRRASAASTLQRYARAKKVTTGFYVVSG